MTTRPPPLTPVERERIVLQHLASRGERHRVAHGALLFALGLIIVGIIGTVAWFTVPIMLADGDTVNGSRFTGGPGARLVIFVIYSLVGAIGLTAMIGGAIVAATGKRPTQLARIMMGSVGAIMMLTVAIRLITGD
jgi:hypothetical protein